MNENKTNCVSGKLRLSTLTTIMISAAVAAAVLMTVLPFATVYTETVEKDAETALEQSVRQTSKAVEAFLSGMESRLSNICGEIASSSDLVEAEKKLSFASRIDDSIESVCVYDESGNMLVCGGSGEHELKDAGVNLSYDAELFSKADGYPVSLPHVQTLYREYYPWVVTMVHREPIAAVGRNIRVAIDFSFHEIAEYIDNIGIGAHGYCFVMDMMGNLVYHPRQQMLYSGIVRESLSPLTDLEDGTYPDGSVVRTLSTIGDTGWRVVGVSYLDAMNEKRDQTLAKALFTTLICCILIAAITGVIFSQILTRPVHSLINSMRGFEKHPDGYLYSPAPNHIAELQLISDSFGQMTWMLRSLMEKTRREEETLRKTELRALQAQINPHFLYNTLDSIQWMCERGKNESAVNMVSALARLFRISISRGHELIPIRDELRHAESYLIIQKYRYSDRFSYRFETDPELDDYLCSKITIQPLIENAIYHGIEPLVDEGEIVISTASDGEDIILTVSDNGVGMSPEQVESLLKKERSDSSGIGIKNVSDRIRIYFGEKYGITVESEPDAGTKITVRLPKITKESGNEN